MRALACLILAVACAAPPPPPPQPVARAPAPALPDASPPDRPERPEPAIREATTVEYGDMGFKPLSEKQWETQTRETLARKLKVEPAQLLFSSDRQWVAALRGPPPPPPSAKPPRKPRPRRFQIVVSGVDGKRPRVIRPVTAPGSDEPPRALRFLSPAALVYEVVAPPTPPAPVKKGKAAKAKPASRATPKPAAKPGPPERLFVIQPIGRRGRPVRCRGTRFAFTAQHDHVAHVAGTPEAAFVAVDGARTYPRKGRTVVATDPAWSQDGRSLAFVEVPAGGPPRLVLLAEYDNPGGDTTWNLPANAPLEGARVTWASPEKLVVGRAGVKPLFTASFTKELK